MDKNNTDSQTDDDPASGQPTKIPQLSRKFTLSVCLLVLLSMCVFWLISNYTTQNVLRQQADQLGQTLAQQIATQLTELMLTNDLISMNVVLGSLTRDSYIAEVAVLNVDNNLIAAASGTASRLTPLIPLPLRLNPLQGEYVAPVRMADSLAGYVRVSLDLSFIEVALINNLLFIIAATLLMLIVAITITRSYFQYLVTFPLNTLNYALFRIRRGEIEACPEPEQNNEVSAAIRQFNTTAEFLAQNTFLSNLKIGRPDEDSTLPANQPGKEAVTLLCLKLANYQYLASTLPERQLINLLNKYYFFADKVSQLYGGQVCFCTEGELLINFATTAVEEEQAFYAICAGQLFLQLSADISQVGEQKLNTKFRLSVHCGQALSGLYSPITRETNNLTGKTVDLTRQVCDECPDNRLLISQACYEQAGAESRVEADEFIVLDEDYHIVTYLTHAPMAEYKLLLERQAAQLISLYEG